MRQVKRTLVDLTRPFRYPTDNCAAIFNTGEFCARSIGAFLSVVSSGGPIRQPQELLPMFLTHDTGVNLVRQYLNATRIAQEVGKPFMMFETNTASCGGFPGISDAFVAALWGLDYGLTMAYSNFTGALFHVGGQNVYYNPFTPPPSNQTAFRQWTVGRWLAIMTFCRFLTPVKARCTTLLSP